MVQPQRIQTGKKQQDKKQSRKTQAERRLESERALLDATVKIISEQGVGAVTFEALSQVGGFSRGLASSRFGSKAKLIEAVLWDLHDRQEALVEEYGFDAMNGRDAVLTYVDVCLKDFANRHATRAYFMLLSSSVAEANDLRGCFSATHTRVKHRLREWIQKGQSEGNLKKSLDSDGIAMMIGCMLFGMSMTLMVDPKADYEKLHKASVAMVKASLV